MSNFLWGKQLFQQLFGVLWGTRKAKVAKIIFGILCLGLASSLSVFISVKGQSKAPYALKIRIQTWFDCKTSLKTGTNLAILKQCTRPGLSRKSLHRNLGPLIPGRIMYHVVNAELFRPGRVESSRDEILHVNGAADGLGGIPVAPVRLGRGQLGSRVSRRSQEHFENVNQQNSSNFKSNFSD